MKDCFLALLLMGTASSPAAIIGFDLSPAGSDTAVGLSPANETAAVISSGSGNETGSGITFNTDTLTLQLSLGYGSALGFTDLTGAALAAHIHGPAATNVSAPVLIDLAPLTVASTNPATGGSIVGSLVLTTNQAADLLAGLTYVNVLTAAHPEGEIRAQLVPVNVLPVLVCPTSTRVECAGDPGTLVDLTARVADEDGDPVTVIWTANGTAVQTNAVAAGGSTNLTDVVLSGLYQLGTNIVALSAGDGVDSPVTCTATVVVSDTIPPVIVSASISTNLLWPPNHKMVPVKISVVATDICGAVRARIKSIRSNEDVLAKGSGHTSKDWKITGDLTAQLRAERSGKDKNGRIYTLVIEVADQSGNAASTQLTVWVPHDKSQLKVSAPVEKPKSGPDSKSGNAGKDAKKEKSSGKK